MLRRSQKNCTLLISFTADTFIFSCIVWFKKNISGIKLLEETSPTAGNTGSPGRSPHAARRTPSDTCHTDKTVRREENIFTLLSAKLLGHYLQPMYISSLMQGFSLKILVAGERCNIGGEYF